MTPSSRVQQFDEHDRIFSSLCRRLEGAVTLLPKQEQIRVARWIEKLEISGCSNARWNRDRNDYARLLEIMVHRKGLSEPFHVLPADGMLPRFPQHLSISTVKKKTIDPKTISFWNGIHSRISSSPHGSSRSPHRERSDSGKRVKELEQALRDEKIQQSYQLQQLHAVHSAELSTIGTALSLGLDVDRGTLRDHPSGSFFGSAVHPPPDARDGTFESSIAALIAATGIDDALESIHQDLEDSSLSVNPSGRPQPHEFFGNSSHLQPISLPKRSISPQRNSATVANHPPPSPYLSFSEQQSRSTLFNNDHNEPKPSTAAADITSDEDFLAYLEEFQTNLAELQQSTPTKSKIVDEYMNNLYG